ncbi:zinc-ribbon domain-containing protein [Novipirellula sp. SH528]|uniref:zinc-ribbon domain-containing protein n=1 Tax=Novipirellula sp. SH528 TaxID=3454466 RepID=UPI003F9FAED4
MGELDGFTEAIVEELRRELNRLANSGLGVYRFGEGGPPKDAREFVAQVRDLLDSRAVSMLQSSLDGRTFDDIGEEYKFTRSRAQQIFSTSLKKLHVFQDVANALLEPALPLLDQRLYVPIHELAELLQCKEGWEVKLLITVSGFGWSTSDARGVSQFSSKTIDDLCRVLKSLPSGTIGFDNSEIKSIGDLVNAHQVATGKQSDLTARLSGITEWTFPPDACRLLLGEDWVKTFVRAQLVAAGVNGLAFDQIDTGGFVDTETELAALLGSDADHLEGGRFRRPGALYSRADELVDIIRDAGNSIGIEEIVQKSERKWHQSVLVGRYLSQLHSILMTARGQYIHIDALGISLEEVQAIANWGAELLAGERKTIDGEDLFDLFSSSQFANKLSNAYQLVSVVAKHPDVRRLSNNLQLAHRDSFDVSELSLEKADPEIASQWHPSKNGSLTPADVRPNSFKPRWWMCEQQHEFEAMPVYRTRMVRSCPGCQERWNLEKLRHFVTSLRQHLDTFTPAELYVIFQQSGLLNRGGRAKGFVKSLATGRFPRGELDKFIAGEESLVDEFISDDEIDLESLDLLVGDDDNLSDSPDGIETTEPAQSTPQKLPEVTAKAALDAMDSPVIASTDAEAAEFLVASAKAKVWSHAFRDEEAALAEVNTPHDSEYGNRVKTEFLHEYSKAKFLETPRNYSFSISGKITQPNLMQRHVAAEVRDRLRFGNWSGTGAGKTLSAVLATRVCNASLTVVCCPNAVVGSEQSGWRGEIQSIFPDSDVTFKTWEPIWRSGSTHKYLVMNYEQFQQPGSEAQLKRFLDHNEIDFIVIDEVHYAKQRYADQMSQRKRLLQAMVAEAGKKNQQLRVLGLSATPVINNLQEGRSLIEMITGFEHDDLPTKASVPNCMRLHQQLATLGTRWRPDYESSLKIETPELDCSGALDEIHSLGTNPSPLQIEKILTQVRIPEILEAIKRPGRSLVYTHYVDEIDKLLYEAITNAGFRCGFYTGESKEGLVPFKDGTLDVLIGSSSIGTGVDGLQHVCDRLIINSLPWTNAEYEQLIGRIWRQGQASATVEVIVPVTYANIGGERWSYCESKLQRIRYKKSIADAAVDGAVPEGNLRTPAQAQKDVLEWLKRLEAGKEQTVERRTIVVPLSDFGNRAEKRLARYGDFSTMNNRWNAANSSTLATRLIENPEEWEQYHTLYRKARESWPVVPFEEVVRWCNKREGYIVADFGCGEAMLAKAISEKHIVHSFDHVSIDDTVIQCDMSKTPLDDESVDVAVFSLSLMGNNFTNYLREAHRILKIDGHLHIWEAESRFDDVERFASDIEKLGFQIFKPKSKAQFVHIEGRKTERSPDEDLSLSFRASSIP